MWEGIESGGTPHLDQAPTNGALALDTAGGPRAAAGGAQGAERAPVADPVPLLVVGGFLGSGKTTLVLSLARFLTARGRRVAILVNEAGAIDVDGALLRAEGHEVKEIFGGCVCCALGADLREGVAAVSRYRPDLMILEPSGMAEVDRLVRTLSVDQCVERVRVIDVLDLPRLALLRQAAPGVITGGVEAADVVLLNKVDEAGLGRQSAARAFVAERHPAAAVYPISARQGVSDETWGWILGSAGLGRLLP